ncbi:hypothetical protein FLL63_12155 [Vibrio cholerae]|uniref:hypothetical protein n=1 Tax=Vibrio cholerae TaxID=666 RepID=UPI0011590535|nr:hypothetical protein [Vibrio cholerae]TQQ59432.1 hypothetical protein FLL63_12155 [Vibrio cholerae]
MDIFNNRELATATLVIVVFIWVSIKSKEVLPAIELVLKSFCQKAILITTSTLILYISIVVYLLYSIDVWNAGQLKNTILWFVFIGFVQLMNTTKITEPKEYLKASLNSQVKLIVLIEFLVAFHSYGFITELFLVTTATLFACCSAFAKGKPEYKQAQKISDYILAIVGTLIFIDSILNIYNEPGKFISVDTFRDFLVPMLLSVSLLPYVYLFYYFLAYERAFVITHIYTDSKQLQRYAKIRSFVAFKGKPSLIHKWLIYSCIPEFESKKTIQASIDKFKEQQRESTV